MNLAMTLFSLIAAWMAVALAMLWGVLRILHRHPTAVTEKARPVYPRNSLQVTLAGGGSR